MPTVGERIKERRGELGWTQDVLSQKAGISKSFLSDLENSKRSLGAETLLNIARALGRSIDFLMTGDETEANQSEVQVPKALADFAAEEAMSFRQALTLLDMQQQLIAHRSSIKKGELDKVDWRKFYEAVKEFL